MKKLIFSTLVVAAIAGAGNAAGQDGSAGVGPAYGPAVGTPEYYNNSGGRIEYDPAAAREQLRGEGRHHEMRPLTEHERALIGNESRERREHARRLEYERQLAETERRDREFYAAQRREAERARLANSRELERFERERFERERDRSRQRDRLGTRQRDRDGDGISNRRDRFPDDPTRS